MNHEVMFVEAGDRPCTPTLQPLIEAAAEVHRRSSAVGFWVGKPTPTDSGHRAMGGELGRRPAVTLAVVDAQEALLASETVHSSN